MKTVLLMLLLLRPLLSRAQTFKISPADTERKTSYLVMRDSTVLRGRVLRQDSMIIAVQVRGDNMSFVEADQVVRITAQRPAESINGISRGSSRQTVFVMRDGARVPGQFVKRDSTMITVRKPNGQLTFFEPELLSRVDTVYGGINAVSPVITNRFPPWLLTGLTAFMPEKGQFYYRNTWLLLSEFDYGITRFWSVGGSFATPFPFPGPNNEHNYAVRYRANIPQLFTKLSAAITPGFRLGLNASYRIQQQYALASRVRGTISLQALATVGNSQRNVTVSYGLILSGREELFVYPPSWSSSTFPSPTTVSTQNRHFFTLGVMQKVSRNLTFLSDNAINLGSDYNPILSQRATVSFALRLDRPRHAFDLGLYSVISDAERKLYGDPSVRLYPYVGYNLLIVR